MMVTFKDENLMTFRHLFLKGYKDQQLTSYALYTQSDVYDHIYYVIDRVLEFKHQLIIHHRDFVPEFKVVLFRFPVCQSPKPDCR